MDLGSICAAGAALVIPCAYACARRSGAGRRVPCDKTPPDHLLCERFLWWRGAEILLFLALWPLCTWVWRRLLGWWAARRAVEIAARARYLYTAGNAFWLFVAALLGLGSAYLALRLLLGRWLLKERLPLFDAFHDQDYGFPARSITGWIVVSCAALASLLVALGGHCYLRIDDEAITLRGLFSSTAVHAPYPWVLAVAAVRGIGRVEGRLVAMPHFAFFLRDGSHYTSLDLPGPTRPAAASTALHYVARRCGRPIVHLETVADGLHGKRPAPRRGAKRLRAATGSLRDGRRHR